MKRCPHCQSKTHQNKVAKTKVAPQRYRCMHCNRKYTPDPKQQGYPESTRKKAAEMSVDGNNLRRIAQHLKIAPRTVALWVTDVAEALHTIPLPKEVKEAERDECSLSLVIKNEIYILVLLDRKACCILRWRWSGSARSLLCRTLCSRMKSGYGCKKIIVTFKVAEMKLEDVRGQRRR